MSTKRRRYAWLIRYYEARAAGKTMKAAGRQANKAIEHGELETP